MSSQLGLPLAGYCLVFLDAMSVRMQRGWGIVEPLHSSEVGQLPIVEAISPGHPSLPTPHMNAAGYNLGLELMVNGPMTKPVKRELCAHGLKWRASQLVYGARGWSDGTRYD